ncbi:MAG: MotA/TolQ/ExbB proton channel family protein [Nitrospinae bacterium]|jgi:biopolymer transport protein ExbB|nr:MotA/TolQ/ExbB proton channel family protein [Nitrospinota bacterium]
MFEFLARGGVLMIPLGVCSILALAIVLERTLNLRTKKIIQLDILQQVRDLVAENQVSDAMTLCRRYPSVMGRILLVTIANHDREREELRSVVEDAGRQEVTTLDRNLGALGTIAAIAPLLGLTGTVFGMIRTFAIISEKGIAHPSQLAGGISEALITTATGLVIAIPTLIFYNYFTNKADRLILEIEKHSYRVVETLKR